jgi:hypothetical protein
MKTNSKYLRASRQKLLDDDRLTHRQRVLMYSNINSITRWPSDDELKRLYSVLYRAKDVEALYRFEARFDLERLFPDETPELPQVTEQQVRDGFREIRRIVRRVNPNVRPVKSVENPMARFPYPGRRYCRNELPGSPSLTHYFFTAEDGTVYFLKRSYLEDQPKKWLLQFARKNDIFVTTPRMIKGTVDDISLNGLVLQILDNPVHQEALVEAMQSRSPKLRPADADAILSGEYITIDK